ncbi:MAG: hypothetical protein ABI658_28890 [Acidimicrobiales bacterium]
MIDASTYVLTNETTGLTTSHESLNRALDAVIDEIGCGDDWMIELWAHGRPLRWVAEGRGHARNDDDTPTRPRRRMVSH